MYSSYSTLSGHWSEERCMNAIQTKKVIDYFVIFPSLLKKKIGFYLSVCISVCQFVQQQARSSLAAHYHIIDM